jgi:hypothetical protein
MVKGKGKKKKAREEKGIKQRHKLCYSTASEISMVI